MCLNPAPSEFSRIQLQRSTANTALQIRQTRRLPPRGLRSSDECDGPFLFQVARKIGRAPEARLRSRPALARRRDSARNPRRQTLGRPALWCSESPPLERVRQSRRFAAGVSSRRSRRYPLAPPVAPMSLLLRRTAPVGSESQYRRHTGPVQQVIPPRESQSSSGRSLRSPAKSSYRLLRRGGWSRPA